MPKVLQSYLEVLQLSAVILQLPFFVFDLCLSLSLLLRGKKKTSSVEPCWITDWSYIPKFLMLQKGYGCFTDITNNDYYGLLRNKSCMHTRSRLSLTNALFTLYPVTDV